MTRNYWYYFYLLFLELLQMRDTELMMSRLLVLKMIDILTASLRKKATLSVPVLRIQLSNYVLKIKLNNDISVSLFCPKSPN